MRTAAVALLLCFGALLNAQEFKRNGTSGFVFLELPVNARSAALGESTLPLHDEGAGGVFQNPGCLGFAKAAHSASFSYAPWFADTRHYGVSYALGTEAGVFAVSMVALDFGTMPRTTRSVGQRVYEVSGEFSAGALAIGVSYSRRMTEQFSFGITLKRASETIDGISASNLLFDGGVLYLTGLGSLRFAAAVQNFGTDAQYKNDPFRMPGMLRLGLAADAPGMGEGVRVTGMVEALHRSDGDERFNAGAEVAWRDVLFVRGGYKFFTDEESFTAGIGVRGGQTVPAHVDVAVTDYGRLGTILRLSLGFDLE